MTRALPSGITGREVIFGGGLHAAIYAATRVAMGHEKPVVFEQNLATGGVFAKLAAFRMNSANAASVASVASPGPTRVPSVSPSDDLNWIPNSAHQVRDITRAEYPDSYDMCRAIQRTLKESADVYTGANRVTFDSTGSVILDDYVLGQAKRVIFAGGFVARTEYPTEKSVMSGLAFLSTPVSELDRMELDRMKIAIVGSGDTAAQVAEYMLGQGLVLPARLPSSIHWYGGVRMPTIKGLWMDRSHARWAALGRHFPEDSSQSAVIRPFPVLGEMVPLGNAAMVNGQVYDLAVMATGVRPATCPVRSATELYTVGNMVVARANSARVSTGYPSVYVIGSASQLGVKYGPYTSRFPAARDSIYNLGPRTAALAASLP